MGLSTQEMMIAALVLTIAGLAALSAVRVVIRTVVLAMFLFGAIWYITEPEAAKTGISEIKDTALSALTDLVPEEAQDEFREALGGLAEGLSGSLNAESLREALSLVNNGRERLEELVEQHRSGKGLPLTTEELEIIEGLLESAPPLEDAVDAEVSGQADEPLEENSVPSVEPQPEEFDPTR